MMFTDKHDSEPATDTVEIDYGSLVWYISEICGGMDLHSFVKHQEARHFGEVIRANCPEIDVEINLNTVRLRLK